MLIEFSVENYRAFREKQTFSMVASATTERAGHGHVLNTGLSAVPHVLSEACLFGANGSGKTSLIDAMRFMRSFVLNSFHEGPERAINVKPFKFHSTWRGRPSEFEVIFFHDEVLYQYGFVVNHARVWEEWLFTRPSSTGRERHIFSRTYDPDTDAYDWDINAEQLKGKRDSWKEATRQDALFLTTAVHMNAESLNVVWNWIRSQWRLTTPEEMQAGSMSATQSLEDEWKLRIVEFLKQADISLHDLRAEEKDMPEAFQDVVHAINRAVENENALDPKDMKRVEVHTVRLDDQETPVELPLEYESTGTRALFNLSVPIMMALDQGLALVVDELNTGLHPLAFQHLVGMFADPKINTKGAQLIFTTHDTSVSEQECMGRDQIWLVEKGRDLAAKLVPLSDFKERGAKGFQKKYLDGRFGGVPRVAS